MNIYGVIIVSIKVNGSKIRCMGRENLLGQMAKNISVYYWCIYLGDYVDDKKEGYGEFYW